jgi:hypothetical protein
VNGLKIGFSPYFIGVIVVCSFNGKELLRFVGCLEESPTHFIRDQIIFVAVELEKRNVDS